MKSTSPISQLIDAQKKITALQDWRDEVFSKVIRAIGIAATLAFGANIILAYESTNKNTLLLYTVSYLLIVIAAFAPRLNTVYRAHIFTTVILFTGMITSAEKAAIGDGRIWLVLAVFLATVFLGRRAGLVYAAIAAIAWALIGYLLNSDLLPYRELDQFSFEIWAGTTLSLLIASITIVLTINALSMHLSQSVDKKAALAKVSEEQKEELAEQRDALLRRSNTLEISAKISRQLISATSKEDIIKETPELFQKEFEFERAVLLLFDAEDVLRQESSSERGKQARNRRTFLSSTEKDLTERAITDAQAYPDISFEIEEAPRAKLALPIKGQEKTLGALFLQSKDLEAFGEEKISILQILTDHIAILLENSTLLAQKESALEAERRAYGEIAQGAWQGFVERQEFKSYRRDEKGLRRVPAEDYLAQKEEEAAETIPISIRGKIIGHINAQKPKNRAWTASEKELLAILTSRLESAIDSARLFQDAQERAEREKIISKTSAKISESLNIENVLKVGAEELRAALNLEEAEIRISPNNDEAN
ncbi:MAG: GAF domain-containing protein [Anaerolineae bacterium]|jgi:GAF domain-containing protein|nr:GAF domain-containing protein [Anaerolineae bacterium]MBT7781480.1 GAF domain-containing protein [Anaerolineae bacterium]